MYSYTNSLIYICIDKSENGIISGRVACPMLPLPKKFCDIGHMLLQTESILDTIGYPCAFQRLRTFSNEQPEAPKQRRQPMNQSETQITEHAPGALYTISLKINSRQNASWQGVAKLENGENYIFKSALQFLKKVNDICESDFNK